MRESCRTFCGSGLRRIPRHQWLRVELASPAGGQPPTRIDQDDISSPNADAGNHVRELALPGRLLPVLLVDEVGREFAVRQRLPLGDGRQGIAASLCERIFEAGVIISIRKTHFAY